MAPVYSAFVVAGLAHVLLIPQSDQFKAYKHWKLSVGVRRLVQVARSDFTPTVAPDVALITHQVGGMRSEDVDQHGRRLLPDPTLRQPTARRSVPRTISLFDEVCPVSVQWAAFAINLTVDGLAAYSRCSWAAQSDGARTGRNRVGLSASKHAAGTCACRCCSGLSRRGRPKLHASTTNWPVGAPAVPKLAIRHRDASSGWAGPSCCPPADSVPLAWVGHLRELAATGEPLVATHLPFPSVCRVTVAGDVFRCVPPSGITDRLAGIAPGCHIVQHLRAGQCSPVAQDFWLPISPVGSAAPFGLLVAH
jgi:hypothetical protein